MKSIYFPSRNSPPPADLPLPIPAFIRNAGAAVCCHPVIEGSLLSPLCAALAAMGKLQPGESALGVLMAKTYAAIACSPSFLRTGSAVRFCLSAKPQGGHYFLHVPKRVDAGTPVLLLLHGYGGNLLYFPWAIWKEVPHCILIAPSWQVDWAEGSFTSRLCYLEEAFADAEKRIGQKLNRPWLVPLSQGGVIAFKLATQAPAKFSGLLGVSTAPESLWDLSKLNRKFPVHLLHGDLDQRVPCADAQNAVAAIQQLGGNAEVTAIAEANHFFVLSHRHAVGDFLRQHV